MTGRKGSDRASIEKRRDAVLRYRIRQAKSYEIAKALNISLTTVYRDLEELDQSLVMEIARAQIRPIKLALLEMEYRERELWQLYDRENPKVIKKIKGKDVDCTPDDRFVRLAVMDRLITIYREKNKLLALDKPETTVQSQEEEMPLDEYEEIREAMLKRGEKIRKPDS